jgi:hypothetical protein
MAGQLGLRPSQRAKPYIDQHINDYRSVQQTSEGGSSTRLTFALHAELFELTAECGNVAKDLRAQTE